jgi:hypothetical protein
VTGLGVYAMPVSEVQGGELIKTSDCPYSLLYVLDEITPNGFRGLDPFTGNVVHYRAPVSPVFNYFVRMDSICGSLFAETEEVDEEAADVEDDWGDSPLRHLLPLLMLGSQGSNTSSLMTLLLVMQALGRRP